MKYSFAGAVLILLGLFGIVILVMFENVAINNESEYYVLKEAVEASMYESIDYAYYRETGNLKILEEKFVANCTRRFYKNISGSGSGYVLRFYDIMESPPKVTVAAVSTTDVYRITEKTEDFDIVNDLSAILEFNQS